MNPPFLPNRKRPARLPLFESGNLTPIMFVTVCSKNRKPILAEPDVYEILEANRGSPDSHWLVGRHVILPDHIHLFCSPRSELSLPITTWVKFWKSATAKRWPRPDEHPIWQVGAWDSQLRRDESYGEKWEYVRTNPVRHGLATTPEDWPYQGEIERLEWQDA